MGSSNKKVVIIGAGFAGLQAMRILAKDKGIDTLVINPKKSTFKPSLPEVILGKTDEKTVAIETERVVTKAGAQYHDGKAVSINRKDSTVTTDDGSTFPYDSLLIASGSIAATASPDTLSLLEIEDALAIRETLLQKLQTNKKPEILVAGGGYTGIELITAMARICKKRGGQEGRFQLVEHQPELLQHLRKRVRKKTIRNLERASITIRLDSHFEQKKRKYFLNGEEVHPDIVALAIGFKGAASGLLPDFCDEKSGRLITNPFLQVTEDIFAAGDAALFLHNGKPLRQSVNFAYYAGKCAARNISASLRGGKMHPFKPRDLGYLIPNYATGRASGESGGLYLGGRFAMLLHSLMATFRAFSWKQRLKFIRALFNRTK